jgi:hypothetical protein
MASSVAPPPEVAFMVPTTPATLEDLFAAACAPDLPSKHADKLLRALIDLRRGQRLDNAKKVASALKKAGAAVRRLPDGSLQDWFEMSLAAQ